MKKGYERDRELLGESCLFQRYAWEQLWWHLCTTPKPLNWAHPLFCLPLCVRCNMLPHYLLSIPSQMREYRTWQPFFKFHSLSLFSHRPLFKFTLSSSLFLSSAYHVCTADDCIYQCLHRNHNSRMKTQAVKAATYQSYTVHFTCPHGGIALTHPIRLWYSQTHSHQTHQ